MPIEIKNQHVVVQLTEQKLDRCLQAFERQLQDEATRIVVRTQQGLDVDGQSFVDYSPKYAKYRENKGRKTSPVDLTFSGNMLAAITTQVTRTPEGAVGRIFFNSVREALKAAGNQARRRFFGLADEQVRRIVDVMKNA